MFGRIDPHLPLVVVAVHLEAEYLHTDLPVLVTGAGKVAATRSVMAAVAPLHRHARPKAIVNVGTAGALRPGLDGTHLVGRVIQHDIDGAAIAKLVGIDPAPTLHLGDGLVLARAISSSTMTPGATNWRSARIWWIWRATRSPRRREPWISPSRSSSM